MRSPSRKTSAAALLIAAGLCLSSTANAAQTFSFDFSGSSIAPGGYGYSSDENGNWWAVAPAASDANVAFSGMSGIQANSAAWHFTAAPNGLGQTAFLQAYNGAAAAGGPPAPGSIALTLPGLHAGDTYTLTFSDEGRAGYGAATVVTSYDGVSDTLNAANISTTGFQTHTFTFTAAAGSDVVKLSTVTSSAFDVATAIAGLEVIDTSPATPSSGSPGSNPPSPIGTQGGPPVQTPPTNDPIPSAVPEPASWALMLFGIGGVGALLRRHRVRALA